MPRPPTAKIRSERIGTADHSKSRREDLYRRPKNDHGRDVINFLSALVFGIGVALLLASLMTGEINIDRSTIMAATMVVVGGVVARMTRRGRKRRSRPQK